MTSVVVCAMCKNCKIENGKLTCFAFPNGIPKEFIENNNPEELEYCNNGYGFKSIKNKD